MTAGLPLDPADRLVGPVVVEPVADQPSEPVGVGAAEVAVGDEAAAAGIGGQQQRTVACDRDRPGSLSLGSELVVIGAQQPFVLRHRPSP